MEYLLLLAGVFMGWSLGTNDGANAFGTAVATGVVKYKTAVTIIATFVIIGAFLSGSGNLTIVIMGNTMGIPVSTSQAVVGAVVGAGITKGWRCVNFGVFKNIAIAWVSSPLVAGLMTYAVAVVTKGYFG